MVTQVKVRTRLLMDTQRGVIEVAEFGPGQWVGPRIVFDHPQPGQRYMSGYCLTVDADGRTIYLGGRQGVFRSRDWGRTWEHRSEGLTQPEVFTLEAHPARPGVVFAGTKPAAICRSEDYGDSWAEMDISQVPGQELWFYPIAPHTPQARSFAFDPRDPNWIYCAVEEADLLLSRDGGATWEQRSNGLTWPETSPTPRPDCHTVVVDPHDPDTVHLTTGNGYFISLDRGEHWEPRNEGITLDYVRAIAVDRARPGRLLCSASKLPPRWLDKYNIESPQWGEADASLFETLDAGRHWHHVASGFPERSPHIVGSIVQHPTEHHRWFIGTIGGLLYISEDDAASWRVLKVGLPGIIDILALTE